MVDLACICGGIVEAVAVYSTASLFTLIAILIKGQKHGKDKKRKDIRKRH